MRTARDIIDALLRAFKRRRARKPFKVRWRTEHGRIMPGVLLNDRVALFDLMHRSWRRAVK